MTAAPRWQNCIVHRDSEVRTFAAEYFAQASRSVLLVAGAGFDPRSAEIARLLAPIIGSRFKALFLRERRPSPSPDLLAKGDAHAKALTSLVKRSRVAELQVLSDEDRAVIGGHRAVKEIQGEPIDELTDVVLDMSALSVGISFPVAKYFYDVCRSRYSHINVHVMVASHPGLESAITGVPNDVVDPIRGFPGAIDLQDSAQEPKIWLPQLSLGKGEALRRIRGSILGPVEVCPVLPISQRSPRSADDLVSSFENEIMEEWDVDARNLVYAIEDDPLDFYRTVSAIRRRYDNVFAKVTASHVVLSPSGSKVLAIGALMAALEYELPVRYVESVSYEVDWKAVDAIARIPSCLVHVWLHGEPYVEERREPTVQSAQLQR